MSTGVPLQTQQTHTCGKLILSAASKSSQIVVSLLPTLQVDSDASAFAQLARALQLALLAGAPAASDGGPVGGAHQTSRALCHSSGGGRRRLRGPPDEAGVLLDGRRAEDPVPGNGEQQRKNTSLKKLQRDTPRTWIVSDHMTDPLCAVRIIQKKGSLPSLVPHLIFCSKPVSRESLQRDA